MKLIITLKLKDINGNDISLKVLKDEPLPMIKERIFCENINYYPNFIKITKNGNTIKKNEFLQSFDDNTDNNWDVVNLRDTFIFNNTITEIFKTNKEFHKFDDYISFYSKYNVDGYDYEWLFDILSLDYIDLTEDDFKYIIEVGNTEFKKEIYKDINRRPDDYQNHTINDMNNSINVCHTRIVNKYKDHYQIHNKFYEACENFKQENLPIINYNSISVELKPIKTINIKLKNLFNSFPLSEKIPVIVIKPHDSKTPVIKIYNNANISNKMLKSWLVNETKKDERDHNYNYKKINGIMFKIKRNDTVSSYITININEFGTIESNIVFDKYKIYNSINDIINLLKSDIQECIDIINRLDIFLNDKIDLSLYNSTIRSMSCSSEIPTRIHNLDLYRNFLQYDTINNDHFIKRQNIKKKTYKRIQTDDDMGERFDESFNFDENFDEHFDESFDEISSEAGTDIIPESGDDVKDISLFYKKYMYKSYSEDNVELSLMRERIACKEMNIQHVVKKGIAVQVKDNPYKKGSIINIYSANLLDEIYFIIAQIQSMDSIVKPGPDTQKLIDKKNPIKDILREAGIEVTAKGCQSSRQVTINDKEKPLDDSYELNYKNLRLLCLDNSEFKYPGFTNEDEVCCFKKDQRLEDAYIRNSDENVLYPSNFLINIDYSVNGKEPLKYKTHLLRNENYDYFYLDKNNKLILIEDKTKIKEIDKKLYEYEKKNSIIWLDKTLLSTLTENSNLCKFNPDLSNKSLDDINKVCDKHKDNIHFGYNKKGYPCCFKEQPKDLIVKPKLNKSYIIQTDKILEKGKIGNLFKIFDDRFNLDKTDKQNIHGFYKIGIINNSESFLHAISFAYGYENNYLIKKKIQNELNERTFNKTLFKKYNSINDFINNMENKKNKKDFRDYIVLLQDILDINIIIFDTPVLRSKSEHTIDQKNIKILCNVNGKPNKEKDFIVLFKREDYFDILIYIEENVEKTIFKYEDSYIFKDITDFYEDSCKKEVHIPTNTKNIDFIDGNTIINALQGTDYKITGQILNKQKRVHLLISENNVLIPIKESTEFDHNIKSYDLKKIILKTVNEYLNEITKINKILKEKKISEIKVIGITHDKKGLVTNFLGYIIPVKKENTQNNEQNVTSLQKMNYNYYNIDDINNKKDNDLLNYLEKHDMIKNEIFKIKKQLSYIISSSEELKNYMNKKNKNISRFDLINFYTTTFKKIINTMKNKHNIDINNNSLYLNIISNELIDDIDNLFLNGIVKKYQNDYDDFKQFNNETLIFNLDDLKKIIDKNS